MAAVLQQDALASWQAMVSLVPVPSHSLIGRRLETTTGTVKQVRSFLTQEGVLHSSPVLHVSAQHCT